MNSPGSQNDRTAFKVSGFGKLLEKLPKGYYIVGDAAYPGSDVTLVPYPGAKVTDSQDAFNYYLSQCRIAIEQTFGILVGLKFQLNFKADCERCSVKNICRCLGLLV